MLTSAYFDNETATAPFKEAAAAVIPFLQEEFGHISQIHQKGNKPAIAAANSYKEIYKLVHAREDDQFYFTASAAEGISGAFFSTYLNTSLRLGKNHFIAASTEEAASLLSLLRLKELGAATTILKANKDGHITTAALKEAITPRTALLSISLVNGLTGVIQKIDEIANLCKERGILLLVDGTHALGKIPVDFATSAIDLLSFSGEQIGALQGTGGLFVRNGLKYDPLILGGCVNTPGLISLGVAAKLAIDAEEYMQGEVARLKYTFESEIQKMIPEVKVAFLEVPRAPHITTLLFPGVFNETLAFLLNREGVEVSLGGVTRQHISTLLEGLGYDEETAASAISFALSRETTEAQIEKAIEKASLLYYKLLNGAKGL